MTTQFALDEFPAEQKVLDPDPDPRGEPTAAAESVTILAGVRAHKLLVATCALAFALLAGGLAWITSPGAQATGKLGLVQPGTGNVLLPVPAGDATMARYTAQRAQFATSDVVLMDVADTLPQTSLEDLRTSVAVVPSKTANAILITSSADTAGRAVAITRAVMDAYRAATLADVTARTEAAAEASRAAGDDAQAQRVTIEGDSFADGVEFEVTPNLEGAETRRLISREVVLGLLVGSGLGALIAWSLEDARMRRAVTEGPGEPRGRE